MSNDEKKLEQHINSIRFDDEPSAAHRDKLEKRLLETYDTQTEYGDYVEPVSVYFRKLAVAAGFLIAAGVLFWAVDSTFISRGPTAELPGKQGAQQIDNDQNAVGTEEKNRLAQLQAERIMSTVPDPATIGMMTVMKTPGAASAIHRWTAKWLGKFGDKKTIEAKIQTLNITDPQNPLVITAESIRQQFTLPTQGKTLLKETTDIQACDSNEP